MRLRMAMQLTGVDRMDRSPTGTDEMGTGRMGTGLKGMELADAERLGARRLGRGCERRGGADDCAES